MRILADTHILLWTLLDPERLPALASQLIGNGSNTILYSTASPWEVAIKHASKPNRMPLGGADFIGLCEESGFQPLSINNDAVLQLETLQQVDGTHPHSDPFDRIMISQAKAADMVFLTHDAILATYEEPCVLVV